jgi:hypothetical protein
VGATATEGELVGVTAAVGIGTGTVDDVVVPDVATEGAEELCALDLVLGDDLVD